MIVTIGPGAKNRWHPDAADSGIRLATGITGLSARQLRLDALGRAENSEQAASALRGAAGFFAVIADAPGATVVAADRIRSIPLFYGEHDGALFVDDDPLWVAERVGGTVDGQALTELALTGYVTGSATTRTGVRQLQAGEMLYVPRNADRVSPVRYFTFDPRYEVQSSLDEDALTARLDEAMRRSVDRLIDFAAGRTIVVPLSGGYDSRILATLLRDGGYDNILTFTYGTSDSAEVVTGREVAERLGLRWNFVPYTAEKWRRWYATDEMHEYLHASHRASSVPHIQDWPAIAELRSSQILPENAIFVPGHTGDMVAGAHLTARRPGDEQWSRGAIVKTIFDTHYALWPARNNAVTLRMLAAIDGRLSSDAASGSYATAMNMIHIWNWQERQAKFIVNAVRSYEQFGYDWWMPMWDAEVVGFWPTVPMPLRSDTILFREYVRREYARVGGVDQASAIKRSNASTLGVGVGRAVSAVERVLPARAAASLRAKARGIRKSALGTRVTDRHPLRWYGWVPEEELRRLVRVHGNINSFVVRDLLRREYGVELDQVLGGSLR